MLVCDDRDLDQKHANEGWMEVNLVDFNRNQ
jgi:hypothetical protein